MGLAAFILDCLNVIEAQGSLSRAKIRHALSIQAPLGTQSALIDEWWRLVCDTLNLTNLCVERDNVFYWTHQSSAQKVQADNVNLN